MDYNVEHFVLAYPVGYLKQAACLFYIPFQNENIPFILKRIEHIT